MPVRQRRDCSNVAPVICWLRPSVVFQPPAVVVDEDLGGHVPAKERRPIVAPVQLLPLLSEQARDPVPIGPPEGVDELEPGAQLHAGLRLGRRTAHLRMAGGRVAKAVLEVDVAALRHIEHDITHVLAPGDGQQPKVDRAKDARLHQPLARVVEARRANHFSRRRRDGILEDRLASAALAHRAHVTPGDAGTSIGLEPDGETVRPGLEDARDPGVGIAVVAQPGLQARPIRGIAVEPERLSVAEHERRRRGAARLDLGRELERDHPGPVALHDRNGDRQPSTRTRERRRSACRHACRDTLRSRRRRAAPTRAGATPRARAGRRSPRCCGPEAPRPGWRQARGVAREPQIDARAARTAHHSKVTCTARSTSRSPRRSRRRQSSARPAARGGPRGRAAPPARRGAGRCSSPRSRAPQRPAGVVAAPFDRDGRTAHDMHGQVDAPVRGRLIMNVDGGFEEALVHEPRLRPAPASWPRK